MQQMRIKIIFAFLFIFLYMQAFAGLDVFVSVLPQKYFLEQIGGERVSVKVMVLPGANPALYEPKPKQMKDLSDADIYFSIGAPFERVWMQKFASANKKMKIASMDSVVPKIAMEKHIHHDEETEHGEHADESGIKDPHVWLDPVYVIKMSELVLDELVSADPEGADYYKNRKENFIRETELLHAELSQILSKSRGKAFMVFHPSWGYFAKRYGLRQIPVELEGKAPKPSDIKEFVELVKELGLDTIFIQPQFSSKAAELIAFETGARVAVMDPLSQQWRQSLLQAARLISGGV